MSFVTHWQRQKADIQSFNICRYGALAALLWSMTGCSSTPAHWYYYQTFTSAPEGATLRQSDGVVLGVTPIEYQYYVRDLEEAEQDGCYTLKGVTAIWASGATATVGPIQWCDKNTQFKTLVIKRPENAPNAQVDIAAEQRSRDARAAKAAASNGTGAPPVPPASPVAPGGAQGLSGSGGAGPGQFSQYYSAESAGITLGSDCEAAEAEASRLVAEMGRQAKSMKPSICQAAKMHRRSGEIGLKLAEVCQNREGSDQLVESMVNMINEADATSAGSCL